MVDNELKILRIVPNEEIYGGKDIQGLPPELEYLKYFDYADFERSIGQFYKTRKDYRQACDEETREQLKRDILNVGFPMCEERAKNLMNKIKENPSLASTEENKCLSVALNEKREIFDLDLKYRGYKLIEGGDSVQNGTNGSVQNGTNSSVQNGTNERVRLRLSERAFLFANSVFAMIQLEQKKISDRGALDFFFSDVDQNEELDMSLLQDIVNDFKDDSTIRQCCSSKSYQYLKEQYSRVSINTGRNFISICGCLLLYRIIKDYPKEYKIFSKLI